ncbi:hypothetical protein V1509DRAFT_32301 [Lipomyces kononenkoae]
MQPTVRYNPVRQSQDEGPLGTYEQTPLTEDSLEDRDSADYSDSGDIFVDIGTIPDKGNNASLDLPSSSTRSRVLEVKKWFYGVFFGKTELSKTSADERRITGALRETALLDVESILKQFETDFSGITESAATKRLAEYGKNELESAVLKSWYVIVFQGVIHPFNVLLLLLGVLAITFADDPTTFYFVLAMVVLSVGLRTHEELKSQKSFQSMREIVKPQTKVLRPDCIGGFIETEVPVTNVVPGDVVNLRPGDIFPGDVVLIDSKDLFVSQSSLTGEFLPVEKTTIANDPQSIFDLANVCFMSTSVVSGRGRAVIVATGQATYMSTVNAALNSGETQTRNSFDVGVRKVAYLLLGFGIVMVPVVILVNGLTTHNFYDAVIFGMSVLVGLIPEMLPMILNANLAHGASEMAKLKTIVRKLDAIQTMGVVDVICSDKTGTLTKDEVVLTDYLDATGASNSDVLKYAFWNSNFSTGLKNVLDSAILAATEECLDVDYASEKGCTLVDELPFDFVRRRMSVVLSTASKTEMICKGAVEELLTICSSVRKYSRKSTDVIMSATHREELLERAVNLNSQGLRVLAVAAKIIPQEDLEGEVHFTAEKDENKLAFLGFLTFLDPPKDDCAAAIEDFKKYHVGIKVLTGDNLAVACNVCSDVGIDTEHCVTGAELDEIVENEEVFHETVERCTVFAKLTPIQKFHVVNALKKNGHTVGFLGDGINDALALRGADCGISVDTATALAKDAADLILLEKSLQVITHAIVRGRQTHANTIKYIKMATSSNFGNVFSVLIASAWLPFQPMTGNQILIQNLLYDISQVAIPWDKVDEEYLLYPHQWSADSVFRFMVYFGPLSSVFDVYTFAVLWFFFDYRQPFTDDVKYFQTSWFYVGLTLQTLIVHMIRTEKIPLIQRNSSWQLGLSTVGVICVGIALPFTPLGTGVLGMLPVPAAFYPFFVVAIAGYCVITQVVKLFYIYRFHEWL